VSGVARGTSEPLAIAIIVSVAVAVALAFVGWIMGIWGAKANIPEELLVYPDSKYDLQRQLLVLHVETNIKPVLRIVRIDVYNVSLQPGDCVLIVEEGRAWSRGGDVYAVPGSRFYLRCPVPRSVVIGKNYINVVVMSADFVYPTTVRVVG